VAESFEAGLRDLGYMPGVSVHIEYRSANGRYDRLPALVGELVAAGVQVIVAPSVTAALAAKAASPGTPVVFAVVSEPVELGLVESLSRPGGNVTGLSYQLTQGIIAKQVQFLREIRPGLGSLGFLYNPDNRGNIRLLAESMAVAEAAGLRTLSVGARNGAEIDDAFRQVMANRVEALMVLAEPVLSEHRQKIGRLALEARLPTIAGSREDLAHGILLTYSANRSDLIRRSAIYVDKILRGSRPADLPVEQPTRFELVLSLSAARALGLQLPETLLASADEVLD
jgi:putative ABC transport system substrate-binding protein